MHTPFYEVIAAKLVKKFSEFYGSQDVISPRWCPYLDMVVRLGWSKDPERYTGGSVGPPMSERSKVMTQRK
jgi:hypothetical protein